MFTTQRILKDIQEYRQNKPDGITLNIDDKDLYNINGYLTFMYGKYMNKIVRITIKFPYNYPFTAPSIYINDIINVCNNISNIWLPKYSLIVFLRYIQYIFDDNPYFEIPHDYFIDNYSKYANFENSNKMDENEQLVCEISKLEQDDTLYGYPILIYYNKKNEMCHKIIVEPMTYETYMHQLREKMKVSQKNNVLKTATNKIFNHWIPHYINQEIFNKYNKIYVFSYNLLNNKINEMITNNVINNICYTLYKLIILILNGTTYNKTKTILAYKGFFKLLKENYHDEMIINVNKFIDNPKYRTYKEHKNIYTILFQYLAINESVEVLVNDVSFIIPFIDEFLMRQLKWIRKNIVNQTDTFKFMKQGYLNFLMILYMQNSIQDIIEYSKNIYLIIDSHDSFYSQINYTKFIGQMNIMEYFAKRFSYHK